MSGTISLSMWRESALGGRRGGIGGTRRIATGGERRRRTGTSSPCISAPARKCEYIEERVRKKRMAHLEESVGPLLGGLDCRAEAMAINEKQKERLE